MNELVVSYNRGDAFALCGIKRLARRVYLGQVKQNLLETYLAPLSSGMQRLNYMIWQNKLDAILLAFRFTSYMLRFSAQACWALAETPIEMELLWQSFSHLLRSSTYTLVERNHTWDSAMAGFSLHSKEWLPSQAQSITLLDTIIYAFRRLINSQEIE